MGEFAVRVTAVGNHGCQRNMGDGATVAGCGEPGCTDCITRRYLTDLRSHGTTVSAATIDHWPGTSAAVHDDLLSGKRSGSF